MAPTVSGQRADKERRLNNLIVFADDLERQLSLPTAAKESGTLLAELEKQNLNFSTSLNSVAGARYDDLDRKGTELWNLCTRLQRSNESNTSRISPMVVLMTRIFAFLLLDCSQSSDKGNFVNVVRVLKVALKTARGCIELKRLDFAFRILEKAAVYEQQLMKRKEQLTPENSNSYTNLSAEYFMIRTTLSWRQDDWSMAEHMFSKTAALERYLKPGTAEDLADLLFEMGSDLLMNKKEDLAVKWLDRAYGVLMNQELENMSANASELRTSIIQSSVKALLLLQQPEATDRARNLILLLENEVGDKLVVLLLRLELLAASVNDSFDSISYANILSRVIRTFNLTEPNFKLIMHHIRKLHDKSPSTACNILDILLSTRVLESENGQWIEAVLVNRIWMATSQREGAEVLEKIEAVFTNIVSNLKEPITSISTHAAQTLLWKRIEANYTLSQYDAAEIWCRLALHRLFENSGDLNRKKITRKLLLCALARNDNSGAREIFASMSAVEKDDSFTRFLMYKIALRANDMELAIESLDKVFNSASKDPALMHACAMDAQQAGNSQLGVMALQMVLEKYEYIAPSSIHLPALLRCAIRLVISQIETTAAAASLVDQLCKLFEGGMFTKHTFSDFSDSKV